MDAILAPATTPTWRRTSTRMAAIRLLLTMLLVNAVRTAPTTTTTATTKQPEQLQLFANLTRSCTSRQCDDELNAQHLLTMQSNMNASADPCTNFHDFACGGWGKQHPNNTSPLQLIDERMFQLFAELFERWRQEAENEVLDTAPPADDVRAKMLTYYKSCRALEQQPLALKSYLRELPILRSGPQPDFDVVRTLAELGRYGYSSPFLQFHVAPEDGGVQRMVLNLDPHDESSNLTWSEQIYEALAEQTASSSEELEQQLSAFEAELLAVVGGSNDSLWEKIVTSISEELDTWYDWLLDNVVGFLGGTVPGPTVAEQQGAFEGSFDVSLYVATLLGRAVDGSEQLSVTDASRIKKVFAFLQQSDNETVRLYTAARFLDFLQSQYNASYTHAATPGNSLSCVQHMNSNLQFLLDLLYKQEFGEERDRDALIVGGVFDSLRQEFKAMLQENDMQLPSSALVYLNEKIDSMRLQIGEVPANATLSDYNELLRDCPLSDGDFVGNHLQALKTVTAMQLSALGKQPHELPAALGVFFRSATSHNGPVSSPYYHLYKNTITIPFAYLRLPFYSAYFWDTLLYGDLANTLGHEIVHGFDSSGLQFDAHGHEPHPSHRRIKANANFAANIKCLQSSTSYLEERIADVSGGRLALRVFQKRVEAKNRDLRLYFLQFAQFFCGAQDEDSFRMEDSSHDMDNVRLNYVLAQTPEFAESFACASGSPLNPASRCRLW